MKKNKFLVNFWPFFLLIIIFFTLFYLPSPTYATVNEPCCKDLKVEKFHYDAKENLCIGEVFLGVTDKKPIICNITSEKCIPVNLENPLEDKGICVYANSNLTPTPTIPPPADDSKCTTVPYQIDASYSGPVSIYGKGIKKGTVYWVIINQGTPNKFAANEDGKLEFIWLRGRSDTPGSAGAETIIVEECGSDIYLCLGRKLICTSNFFVADEALPWQTISPLVFFDNSNPPKQTADPITGKIYTALGCIPLNNFNDFIGWLLSKLIFIASGVAFLLMVLGAIQILTSAGNPDKVKAGKELITSALSGLLLVILSIFLLKLIGVDILHIPGL